MKKVGTYMKPETFLRSLWRRINKTDSCWEWTGRMHPNGYGRGTYPLGSRGEVREALAHRLVYETLVGPIPEGLTLDHLCRNRRCVNPAHLEPVTIQENMRRGEGPAAINARKTHCPKGHPYDEANIYVYNGHRQCRICSIERKRALRRAHAGGVG